ncbi:hypothetical protein EVAR_98335_1 [Eumeta japonica]|uniref:Uncharacterized protein n=1 Tax=Eumeta variegata TaxID=151549 RepID=A0A4C1X9F0_EUMVA|nr:hypothetical protein EVAR_98335_1 [Eumeta japonica]
MWGLRRKGRAGEKERSVRGRRSGRRREERSQGSDKKPIRIHSALRCDRKHTHLRTGAARTAARRFESCMRVDYELEGNHYQLKRPRRGSRVRGGARSFGAQEDRRRPRAPRPALIARRELQIMIIAPRPSWNINWVLILDKWIFILCAERASTRSRRSSVSPGARRRTVRLLRRIRVNRTSSGLL